MFSLLLLLLLQGVLAKAVLNNAQPTDQEVRTQGTYRRTRSGRPPVQAVTKRRQQQQQQQGVSAGPASRLAVWGAREAMAVGTQQSRREAATSACAVVLLKLALTAMRTVMQSAWKMTWGQRVMPVT